MTPPNVAIYMWIRRAFDFQGRSSRADYWWTRLFVLVVNLVLLFVFIAAIGPEASEALSDWLMEISGRDLTAQAPLAEFPEGLSSLSSTALFSLTFLFVFSILTFIPDLSLAWRRFQDMNIPGWVHILFLVGNIFIPLLTVIELIWFVRPGTKGPNKYGPDSADLYL